MIESCKVVQSLLARLLRGELAQARREEVEAHLAACPACRKALDFERSLDADLAQSIRAPAGLLAAARARVVHECGHNVGLSWADRILGRTLMRKMLVSGTALAVLFAVVFAILPGGARAATARETFRQMKAAMKASKQTMEIQVQVTMTPQNQVQAQVTTPSGNQVGPLQVQVGVQRDNQVIHATATVSFDESDFSKIAFGKNKNTLVLTPKKQAGHKYEVLLDRKSKLPLTWTDFAKTANAWKQVGQDKFVYKPKTQTQPKAG